MDATSLYLDCRREFLVACDSAKVAWTRAIQHPLRGPSGEPLYIDLAWLGPADATRLLVLASGTHGIEGPAGSAIQSASLRAGVLAKLPPDTAALLIHAGNPYGFAWLRRCNEYGVDLNRNFIDFHGPLPCSPGFDERLAALLVPEHPLAGREAEATNAALLALITERGLGTLVSGQYRFPFAPFYGGEVPSWSNRRLRELWAELLAPRRRVIYIDYHTGLGERGRGSLLSPHVEVSEGFARARAIWSERAIPATVGDDSNYHAEGDLCSALGLALPGLELVAVAHEFGTQPPAVVLAALRADHRLWQRGDPINPGPERAEARRRMREAFAPDDPSWRASVTGEALDAQRRALNALV